MISPAQSSQEAEHTAPPAGYWSPEIVEIAQRVWGPDHLGPVDEAYVRRILKPLAIDSSMSIVELGSGLGGGARAISRDYDAWVCGYEDDRMLAETAMSLSVRAGLAKKAPIAFFDPETPDLGKKSLDRIIIRDVLGRTDDKARFLQAVQASMKARAQILITDFVLSDGGAADDKVRTWMASRPPTGRNSMVRDPMARPMTVSALLEALKQLKLRVHVAEDESAEIERTITARWNRLRAHLKPEGLHPELVEPLLREGSRWQGCVDALSSGGLRYYRIVASS